MLNDYELVQYITNNLHLYLSEEDQQISCSIVESPQNNQGYKLGIRIDVPGSTHSPIIYVDSIKAAIDHGSSRVEIMEGIAGVVQKAKELLVPSDFNPEDYDAMKKHLSVMLINTDANRDMLKNFPHKEISDLSAVCYLDLPEDPVMGKGLIKVTENLCESWGITKDELFDTALRNDIPSNTPVLQSVQDMIFENNDTNLLSSSVPLPVDKSNIGKNLYALTNESKIYGASVIANTDVLDRISDLFPDGFCMIPSSVHEIMIVPDTDKAMRAELGNMVRSVNMTSCIRPDEVLSDRIYMYDRDSKTIHQVKESLPEKDVQPKFHQNGSFKDMEPKITGINKDHDIKLN